MSFEIFCLSEAEWDEQVDNLNHLLEAEQKQQWQDEQDVFFMAPVNKAASCCTSRSGSPTKPPAKAMPKVETEVKEEENKERAVDGGKR